MTEFTKRFSTHGSTVWATIFVSAGTSLATALVCYSWSQRKVEEVSREWERRRQEERTGRIRAEVKLREVLSQQRHNISQDTTGDPHAMKLSPIGTIISPYNKRMGTPRQGALVPSSRGFIEFLPSVSPEGLDGIDQYSHIWVIFAFHVNTSLATSKKAKIRPPRAGGIKVGQLATRSPHRPNALGLSLVKMEHWEPSARRLHISGLDLVNGTPVYDIKPYVHWDIPGDKYDKSMFRLPDWVEDKNDVLTKVEFSIEAEASLLKFVIQDKLAPLYSIKDNTSFEAAMDTLKEILAQDPRSSHKGAGRNQRGSVSSEPYRLIFCNLEVEFVVVETGARVAAIRLAQTEDT